MFTFSINNFRGGNAPASLKHEYAEMEFFSEGQFPGWKRPGLIEARVEEKYFS